ncbi:MAG: hypothetical protein AB7I04_02570 [Pseudomonadales bacterium]
MTLAAYLSESRRRLKQRFAARGAAAIALTAFALTAGLAFLFVTLVPAGGWIVAARVLLYMVLIGGISWLVWRPVSEARAASELESRVPAFGGRLATWRDAATRGDDTPLFALLTRETEAIAGTAPPADVVRTRDIALPAAAAAALAVALILITTGISPFQLAAQRLWTGDLFTAAAPRITVSPGDTVVPRGADVVVEATAAGFVARGMQMHANFAGTAGWETAPMSRLGEDRYGFVFVGVTEEVAYYAGSAGLTSERHVIKVADLPRVTKVALDYTYPTWTGLPVTHREDGDVAAVTGTEVAITATTDAPIEAPLIVVNGEVLDANVDPETNLTVAAFTVAEPGSWHVAVRHEGTLARISDTYFIDVVADQPPEVAFVWPGHDSQATAIEERTLRFSATDDFGIKTLQLSYAVNGGVWTMAELPVESITETATGAPAGADAPALAEHVLYLEDLRVTSQLPDEPARPLRPGDMISFYAEATDHAQAAKTALYFVDVRPFDRTYRESQANASGGQGGDGGPGELVERQREIVSATWNLINKQSRGEGEPADEDQAEVLALLQRTLRDQVTTLIERAAARRLTMDDEIDTFTSELTAAAEDMAPAAEQLAALDLENAIGPEQQALQHLLAANASMTDVDVSMGEASMRGTAGRSLSELMDLEMDPERNRYETPQNPSMGGESPEQSEEWQRLAELAARQEQLAQQAGRGQESLASRWQQERLQRELERLEEELRRQQQSQQGQQNQSASSQGGSQSQQSGQSRQSQRSMNDAIEDLAQARQAIDRSLDREGSDPNTRREATREATEAIQRAADALRQEALGSLSDRIARGERQAENLLADQRQIMNRLDQVQDDALNARTEAERRFDDYAMSPYAERKRRMQEDLNELTREIGALGDAIDDEAAARSLEQALAEIAQERLDERLAASADAFEFGRPLYAVGNEAAVERALERLTERLGQARRMLEASEGEGGNPSTLAQVRALRAQLTEAMNGLGGEQRGELTRNNTGIGAFDTSDMETMLRQADALEFRAGQEIGGDFELDTALSRAAYVERGTEAANTEVLAQLMKDRLDLIEAALVNQAAAPIRAQEPRDGERDSEAAAEYFEQLGKSSQ